MHHNCRIAQQGKASQGRAGVHGQNQHASGSEVNLRRLKLAPEWLLPLKQFGFHPGSQFLHNYLILREIY